MVNLIEFFSWVNYILNKICVECKMLQNWWVLCQKQLRLTQQGSFFPSFLLSVLPSFLPPFIHSFLPSFLPSPAQSRPVWLLQVVGPPGGGTVARDPVTRDPPDRFPPQASSFCQWDLQQKIYYSCLYPPEGIKDWSIWMWATISSLTCQKWLREFISELCLPLSSTELHFLWGTFKSYSD